MAYGCDLTRVFTYDGSEKDSVINCEIIVKTDGTMHTQPNAARSNYLAADIKLVGRSLNLPGVCSAH